MAFELWEGRRVLGPQQRECWISFCLIGTYPMAAEAHAEGLHIWHDSQDNGAPPHQDRVWGDYAGETESALSSRNFAHPHRFVIKKLPE